jgi:predicted Zn-dependent peptidase
MTDYNLFTLNNGIRIVHKEVPNTKIVHCGFIIDIGSRDEKDTEQGIAHFWEHMAFKGTKKRKAFHILNKLDAVGGELNAYTTKEKICFYASALDKHVESAFDLLKDITFDSIFPEKQIENERGVILEEMSLYSDSPEDAIQDDFDRVIFGDHPLGKNILGTSESIKSMHREDFKKFLRENLNTERVVFSVVGNIPEKKVLKLAKRYFDDIPRYDAVKERVSFIDYQPKTEIIKKSILQTQCAIGTTAYALKDKNRLPFYMLMNILGGPAMNSRLNLALREKFGFVYNVEATYHPFSDVGLFAIYFGTDAAHLKKSNSLVLKELKKLREIKLGSGQLHSAKEQMIGQLAMAQENNTSLMLMMGKSILDFGKIRHLDTVFERIRKITAVQLLDIANEKLLEDQLSHLTFLPKK